MTRKPALKTAQLFFKSAKIKTTKQSYFGNTDVTPGELKDWEVQTITLNYSYCYYYDWLWVGKLGY